MKSSFISILLCFVMLFQNSYTVRIPLSSSTQNLHNSAQKVQPYYQVKKTGKKATVLLGSALVMGGIGYINGSNLFKSDNTVLTTSELQSRGLVYGVAFGSLTYLIASILARKGELGNLSPKITNIPVNNSNFDGWLSKYNNKTNQNFIKYGKDSHSYFLVPKNNMSAYEMEEDRLDNESYRRIINGELDAYGAYINSRPLTSKRYADVLKLKDECYYYYKAINSNLTEINTFTDILSDCERYLKLYPQFKGNDIFFKNVTKKYNDILSIPAYVRDEQISKIREQAEILRKNNQRIQDEKTMFWLGILSIFLSPSNSNGTNLNNKNSYRECSNCNGRGHIGDKDCIVCGGKGSVRISPLD